MAESVVVIKKLLQMRVNIVCFVGNNHSNNPVLPITTILYCVSVESCVATPVLMLVSIVPIDSGYSVSQVFVDVYR